MSGDAGTYGYDYLGRRVWRTVVGSSSTVQTHSIFDEAGRQAGQSARWVVG